MLRERAPAALLACGKGEARGVSGRSDRGWDGLMDFRLQYERTILRASGLDPLTRLLALAIKSRCDENGHCWPMVETLADDTGIAARTVRKHLALLRAGGYLRMQRRRGASLYWLEIPPCLSERHEGAYQTGTTCLSDRHGGASLEENKEETTEETTEGVTLVRASGTDEQKKHPQRKESDPDEVRALVSHSLAATVDGGWAS